MISTGQTLDIKENLFTINTVLAEFREQNYNGDSPYIRCCGINDTQNFV